MITLHQYNKITLLLLLDIISSTVLGSVVPVPRDTTRLIILENVEHQPMQCRRFIYVAR